LRIGREVLVPQRDHDGKFRWNSYGENSRVLARIFNRCQSPGGASLLRDHRVAGGERFDLGEAQAVLADEHFRRRVLVQARSVLGVAHLARTSAAGRRSGSMSIYQAATIST
jgi:hypothetical protein